jgi:hypothetical protein
MEAWSSRPKRSVVGIGTRSGYRSRDASGRPGVIGLLRLPGHAIAYGDEGENRTRNLLHSMSSLDLESRLMDGRPGFRSSRGPPHRRLFPSTARTTTETETPEIDMPFSAVRDHREQRARVGAEYIDRGQVLNMRCSLGRKRFGRTHAALHCGPLA